MIPDEPLARHSSLNFSTEFLALDTSDLALDIISSSFLVMEVLGRCICKESELKWDWQLRRYCHDVNFALG
jgi:hypothetical protein